MAKKKRKLTAWQRHVKSYMASHKGLSFKEALPKAKLTYRKGSNPSKRRASPSPRASKKPRKVKRRMAKRKTRRSRQITIPLAPVLGLFAGMADSMSAVMDGNYYDAVAWATAHYTGYKTWDQSWDFSELKKGLFPLVAGLLVHKFVGGAPLNLNRILAAAKVPLIRI